MEILGKVIAIVSAVLGRPKEEITAQSRLTEDLNMDELDGVETILTLEEAFEIQILDEDIDKFKTVEDIANYVSSKVKKESGDSESGS